MWSLLITNLPAIIFQIQQMKAAGAVINEGLSPGAPGSENGSHVGTPTHAHLHLTNGDLGVSAAESAEVRYGDECIGGRVSLLHFIVFFLLGGLTVLIVGAVQVNQSILHNTSSLGQWFPTFWVLSPCVMFYEHFWSHVTYKL